MKDKFKFIGRATIIHITTYILCGMVFSTLFNYQELFLLENAENFMRPFDGVSTLIGPLAQVIRGVLFGIVLLFIKDYFAGRYGWLKLWFIIAIIGIINTPAPAPFSIEGIIYTQLPLEFHLKGAPEILVQTLLFSYFIARPKKDRKQYKFIEKNKIALLAAIIAAVGFSVCGIVLTFVLKLDIMAGGSDAGALIIMFLAMLVVFLITRWYNNADSKLKALILAIVYYIALAIMPTIYNFIVNSPFKSMLSLIINVAAVLITLLFVCFYKIIERKKVENNL